MTIRYLTGSTNADDEPRLVDAGVGLMIQPGNSYHLQVGRWPVWGADNGCFADRWVEEKWANWLEKVAVDQADAMARCLFAVAPDVYPDAAESLARGQEWSEFVRSLGYPAAIVAQDGAEDLDWPWGDLDCLFLGGEKRTPAAGEWKVSAAAESLVREARREGKWVHMGRVNGLGRLRRAEAMGCLSADGTSLKYLRRLRGGAPVQDKRPDAWQRQVVAERPLPLDHLEGPEHPHHRAGMLR